MFRIVRWTESLQIFAVYIFGQIVFAPVPWVLPPLHAAFAVWAQIIAAYLWNDFFDSASDAMNPRKKTKTAKQLQFIKAMARVFTGISLALSWQINAEFFLITVAMNILWYFYSAPPLRLKTRLPFSQLAHFLSGIIYFLGFSLHLNGVNISTVFLAAFWGLFLLSASLANETIDYSADKMAGDTTLAGHIGSMAAMRLLFIIQTLALTALLLASYSEDLITTMAMTAGSACVYFYFWKKVSGQQSSSVQRFREIYRLLFAFIVCSYLLEFGLGRHIFPS